MTEYVPAITTIKDSKQAIAATSQQFIRQIGAAVRVTLRRFAVPHSSLVTTPVRLGLTCHCFRPQF
jgi:hypothetical protein